MHARRTIGLLLGSAALAVVASGCLANPQDAPPVMLEESASGRVPVGDHDGVVRGTVELEAMDRASDDAGRFLQAHEVELAEMRDGRPVVDEEAMALSDAVMTLEAVPVLADDGTTLVGYFGRQFIELDEFDAATATAHDTVRQATGDAYQPAG